MKRLLLLAFTVTLSAYSVNAQTTNQQGKKVEHAKKRGMDWQKDNLTSEQREKMKAEREKFKSQRAAIQSDPNLSEMQKKERMRELTKEERNKMNGILTPEQREKFAQMRGGENSRKERMDKLDLSADQKTKMNALREQHREESKKIRENTSLSEEQKKAQLEEMRKKQKAEMNGILNQQQKDKLKNARQRRAQK